MYYRVSVFNSDIDIVSFTNDNSDFYSITRIYLCDVDKNFRYEYY